MSQDIFNKFVASVAPFRTLWNSVHLSVLAARFQEKLITVATRLQTSELMPDRNHTLLEPTSDMLFFSGLLPIEELGQVVFGLIKDGRLQLRAQGISECLYLSSTYAGARRSQEALVSWSGPWLREDLASNQDMVGMRRPVIYLNGNNANERFVDFVDDSMRKKFESELRLSQPAFNGLKDLQAKHFRGLELGTYSNCNVLIACQIPFELECSSAGLEVIMPSHVSNEPVQVRGFFEPTGGNTLLELKEAGRNGLALKKLRGKITWPEGSERVNATLLYDRLHITDGEFSRWPNAGNIRVATDVFFDSEHKSLDAGLFRLVGTGNKSFEKAVTRLLVLVGIPAINYSSGDDRRPDIAATVMRADKKPIVLLGECTRERPIEKFSALRERASELSALLQEQADILPLVFAQCNPVASDYESASEHGIALVGKQEIIQLFQWLSSPLSTEEVIAYLESLIRPTDIASLMRQRSRFGH